MRILRYLSNSSLPLLAFLLNHASGDRIESRHSFSLTTFDTQGKLLQVERAILAASMGTPVVAVAQKDHVLFAAPQVLPSPFYEDDGTPRFARISPNIIVSHSGLAADGRVILAAAQRMAVEHEYTFDEPIPIRLFLEELSLLFQEYTMKPAARPFGAFLLVGYMPFNDDAPTLFRLDPSGNIDSVDDNYILLNGGLERTQLSSFLQESCDKDAVLSEESLARAVEEALQEQATKKGKGDMELPRRMLTAKLSKSGTYVSNRFDCK